MSPTEFPNVSATLSNFPQPSDLKSTAEQILTYLIQQEPFRWSNPNHENNVVVECVEILNCLYPSLLQGQEKISADPNNTSFSAMSVTKIAHVAIETVCKRLETHAPMRSHRESRPILTYPQSNMPRRLNTLLSIKQPEQRTPEWYEMRNNLITASSAWKALGSPAITFSFLKEKVDAYYARRDAEKMDREMKMRKETSTLPLSFGSSDGTDSADSTSTTPITMDRWLGSDHENSPLTWGKRYEPLSVMLYEKRYSTIIQEYGCIIHPKHGYIGASPDGINYKKGSPIIGRMLEIKNVYTRIINGTPKEEYWIQMQLQMEVCDLNECDFLETKFNEFTSYTEYVAARENWIQIGETPFLNGSVDMHFGTIAAFSTTRPEHEGGIYYEYCPVGLNLDEQDTWLNQIREAREAEGYHWYRAIYWQLVEFSCVLVFRNRSWFNAVLPKLDEFWKRVMYYRTNESEWKVLRDKKRTARAIAKDFKDATSSVINPNSKFRNTSGSSINSGVCLLNLRGNQS